MKTNQSKHELKFLAISLVQKLLDVAIVFVAFNFCFHLLTFDPNVAFKVDGTQVVSNDFSVIWMVLEEAGNTL